jgi:microcystin-dependent protein
VQDLSAKIYRFDMKKLLFLVAFFSVFSSFGMQQAQAQVNPYLGEVRWVGYNFCPRGWTAAEGQLLSISSNTALFSLFGTYYGGDGRTTFGLPDLRGRTAVGDGSGPGLSPKTEGQRGGSETETLNITQIPSHNHTISGVSEGASSSTPTGNYLAKSGNYRASGTTATLHSSTVGNTGGTQSHNNMSPYLVSKACVAVVGTYPSRS